MDGILNINKPPGKTSYDIVDIVKRGSGEKHVGHAGTLDPAASGVLPVCLGQSTRVIEFLMDATKTYLAEMELGMVTDTYDASGKIIQRGDPTSISRAQFRTALDSFVGLIQQTPPMYSAIKHQGKPLYELARAGISVARESRPVKIYRLELTDWKPPLAIIEVECGKGTYIRSLAHDLGQMLGCGACLKSLVRLRCGPFHSNSAISLPQLEDAFHYGYWWRFLYPADIILQHWPAMILGRANEQLVRNGNFIKTPTSQIKSTPADFCRAYTLEGDFLGVLRFDPQEALWQPRKVFH